MESIVDQGKYVLVAEDNPSDLLFIHTALDTFKIKANILVLKSGREIVDFLVSKTSDERDLPKFLMMDLHLPNLGGMEVLEILASNSITKELPVIIFSSSVIPKIDHKCKSLGASEVIEKPFMLNDFLAAVKNIFDNYYQ